VYSTQFIATVNCGAVHILQLVSLPIDQRRKTKRKTGRGRLRARDHQLPG
jgi:hypothetical protein